jgi:hypothetical protein
MENLDKTLMEEANKKLFVGKNSNCNNVVFVYTPIKVGSTTLVTSIRISANQNFVVLHVHNEDCLRVLTGIQKITINELILYNSFIGKKVYVIDVYRSPVERKISTFFELIEMHFNNSQEKMNEYSLDRVVNRFQNLFLHIAKEDYFQGKYQIPFPSEFDFEKKYLFVEDNKVKYIKLRLKDSAEWGSILSLLLETEIVIVNDYETNGKQIKDLYEKFKNQYRIPCNLLEELKNDKYLNYYYSLEERNVYLSEWERKRGESVVVYNEQEYDLYLKITIENATKSLLQKNHYIDVGCSCAMCSKKRQSLFEKAKKGEKVVEKIQHNELVQNFIQHTNERINAKVKIMNKVRIENQKFRKGVKKSMVISS